MQTIMRTAAIAAALTTLFLAGPITAAAAPDDERGFFDGLEYRNIGPWRGGRVTAVAGWAGDPLLYYMGATGGGVWKTTNAGAAWSNVTDDEFAMGSVGAIDVAPSDKNVIFAGMGESPFRGVASSQGDGVYKSSDGGETWAHMGLEATRQISSIKIHPDNANVVLLAAQGDIWAPSNDRGVYKSSDGGESWRKVLAGENNTSGAVDLKYDAANPRIVYAAMWDHRRRPWEVRSGGEGSGIWKSVDFGETWEQLTDGLPEAVGKIGVAPSPAKPGLVWAIVEAKDDGGLYRSDDYGATWRHVNGERRIQARSWYYMHIFADPQDEHTVYVQNSSFLKSVDGGKSFGTIVAPHGDHHDLWINPHNASTMIDGNDGGANVSFDGGASWSTQMNQPTGQFYRVNTDNLFPYRVYGGQQDNSTVGILSRGADGAIGREDYRAVGGCESAHVGFDPDNPRYIYAGCYLGLITEFDAETETTRDIETYPELAFGVAPRERKYRFNWNAPIVVSQHDPSVIYHAGNMVFRSTDRGRSWTAVSPDLSRNDPDTQGPGGGPITNEVSENYNTVLYLEESPHDAAVIYAGTDDGLLHVTRDGGESWNDVTPRGVDNGMINAIDASPHTPGKAYVAATRYKLGDRRPMLYVTENYGRSWRRIDSGLPNDAFTRVVREDVERPGLLFAGAERGVFISFDDGGSWRDLQLNLPGVAVTDMKVQGRDLVLSTQGRGFWILDDISPLRAHSRSAENAAAHLFAPETAYRISGASDRPAGLSPNPPNGAVIYYALREAPDLAETAVKLEILDSDGAVIRTLTSDADTGAEGGGGGSAYKLPAQKGLNRMVWDFARDNLIDIPGAFSIAGGGDKIISGPVVAPGRYALRLSLGDDVVGEAPLEVLWDPRIDVSSDDVAEQQRLALQAAALIDELHGSVNSLRKVKAQAETRKGLIEDEDSPLAGAADALIEAVDAWEATVISAEREFFQDVLNWPDRLDSDLQVVYLGLDSATTGVTQGLRDRLADLRGDWDVAMTARDALTAGEIAAYNAAFEDAGAPGVVTPEFVAQD